MSTSNSNGHASKVNSERDYHAAMELLYADGEWYRLPRWIFKIRPRDPKTDEPVPLKDAAYTLAAMLNQSSFQKAVRCNDGWFEYSSERGEEDTGFARDRQHCHIDRLTELGLIETRRKREIGGRREVKIGWEALVALITEADSRSGEIPKVPPSGSSEKPTTHVGKTHNPNNSVDSERHCRRPTAAGVRPPLTPPAAEAERREDSPAYRLARLLFEGLGKKRKITTKPSLLSWSREFAALLSHRTFAEIDKHIRWLTDHIHERYTPQTLCAKTFCSRFPEVEAARLRSTNPSGNRVSDYDSDRLPDGESF